MNGRDSEGLSPAQPLTPREDEILALIGQGKTNRQIAEELTVARSTVKWYVRQIYNKLSVYNREEAIGRARELGLIVGEDGAVRHNLPVAATPFVGREAELAALAGLIADPQVRVITITGPGGIGKTRLALEAAGREICAQPLFRDGVFFVSLAPLESAEEITAALATALDFQFQDSGNEPEQLLNYLRNKQMLLVMDNFEHILDGRGLLAKFNKQAAGIIMLVTSRARLKMRGEQLFPLGGLETMQEDETLGETPASELFLHIARRTAPDFQLLEGDAEHVLRICLLVEGMPLGLELAASWAGLLPLSEIAAELEQSLDLLASEDHDVPPRHRSMEAALDLSWHRLTSEQQRVFLELTVFRGGFTRAAALEVAGATLPLLVTLVNKSWLNYDRQEDRYHIHELLRHYGAAKLSAKPAYEQDVRARHSTYFCGYLQEREADWYGPRQKEAAADIGEEIDNIQHAWRWAASKGHVALLAQGLNSLCRFFLWEGRLQDGQKACRNAADGVLHSGSEQQADGPLRLAFWSRLLAWESKFVNEMASKETLLEQSQGILDRLASGGHDIRAEQAFVFLSKADAGLNSNLDEAIHFANLGLPLFRELGSSWGEARTLQDLGRGYLFRGDYETADEHFRNSLEIMRLLDDKLGIAKTIQNLGTIARQRGSFSEAEGLHQQSLEIMRQLQSRFHEKVCLTALSYTLSWSGKFPAARETARQVMKLDQDLGQHPDSHRLNIEALAASHLGYYSETRIMAAEALELARKEGLSGQIGWALMSLGAVAYAERDLVRARHYLQESIKALSQLQNILLALPLAAVSYVIRAQGDGSSARKHVANVLRAGTEHHAISPIIYCLPLVALFAADDSDARRAIELYGLALRFGHISNSCWFADVAGKELDEVRASLPADVAAAAEARGREMDVWETAEALRWEMDGR